MSLSVDVYWSFRSPYSYLATTRLVEMRRTYQVDILFRPVYPLAVRKTDFFATVNPAWVKYVQRDAPRLAEFLGLPFRWPKPDPIVQDMTTLEVAAEQPYIHRLTRLGAMAQLEGRSLAFTCAIARVLWDGSVAGWNEGDHLARAAEKAGFDLAAMDAAITADPDRYEQVIAENETDHAASGHWGVPTFVFENEPFFGQDRVDLLVWRMQSKGLTRR